MASRGITLIEVLVSIAIIVILLGLVASSLLKSQATAQDLISAQRAASHASVIAVYRHDFRELFPYFTNPAGGYVELTSVRSGSVQALYFDAPYYWNIALADGYYDGDPFTAFHNRGFRGAHYNTWRYPLAFITRPAYWDPLTRQAPPSQFAPTRGDEVRFTSSKALIVEYLTTEERSQSLSDFTTGSNAVAFTDGHAASLRQLTPYDPAYDVRPPDAFSPWSQTAFWFHPFGVTRNGVYGRDVR